MIKKNIKLVRIVEPIALALEQLSTEVIKIEAVLNSNLLTPLTDDPNYLLTSCKFLIGHELISLLSQKMFHQLTSN